jgi:hypothetical protein
MEYWQDNFTKFDADQDVKFTAECIPPPDAAERVCFDQIGVPVMQFAIFGNITCLGDSGGTCDPCNVSAGGLQGTFLLNKNSYSFETAQQWEDEVFIANINDDLKEDMVYN